MQVWAVLKPGFLAFLEEPLSTKLLDIIVFDVLPTTIESGESGVYLAKQIKESNPLRYAFKVSVAFSVLLTLIISFWNFCFNNNYNIGKCQKVSCGNRTIDLRTSSNGKVKDWITAINDVGLRPHEGWCRPHRFGSFAPPRGLTEDGSQAQWFIDGQAAFEAIASAIQDAKSEVNSSSAKTTY